MRWRQRQRANAAVRVHIDDAGRRTPWLEWGREDQPRFIWFHGFSGRPEGFLPVATHLQGVHGMAPALPGFHAGWRDPQQTHTIAHWVDWLEPVIDAVGSAPFVVGGNSLGGALALELAARRPDQVRGVVALNPAGIQIADVPSVSDEIARGDSPFCIEHVADLRRLFERIWGQPIRIPWFIEPALFRDFHRNVDWYARLGSDLSKSELHTPTGGVTTTTDPSRIRVPVQILWGIDDQLFPAVHGERLAALLPQGQLDVLEATGHCPQLQHPERIAQMLASFIASR